MAILTPCQSEHKRQVKMMNDLMEATDNYEVMPNDSLARAVLFYMERHGTPLELQQAWRMMAKMYRRHGALIYEGLAYEMAADCVDSLSNDYDPRALAEICYEWSINQQFSLDDWLSKQTARRGMDLALQAGDTLLYYRCMGAGGLRGIVGKWRCTVPSHRLPSFFRIVAAGTEGLGRRCVLSLYVLSAELRSEVAHRCYQQRRRHGSLSQWPNGGGTHS